MTGVELKTKLLAAWCLFSFACGRRLEKEEKEGRVGWDDTYYRKEWEGRIRMLAGKKLTLRRLVNIANYCGFLWNMEKEKRRKLKALTLSRKEEKYC